MRKSVVLALLLVLAVAGSSFAATVSWSGEFNAKADYESKYLSPEHAKIFGKFTMSQGLKLNVGIKDDQDVWSADFALAGAGNIGPKDPVPVLGRYVVKVNESSFNATAWGNYGTASIGNRGDAFEFVQMDGENAASAPKLRVTTNLGGFDLAAQLDGSNFAVDGRSEISGFTFGAILDHKFSTAAAGDPSNAVNKFGIYGGTTLGIVGLDAAFATHSGEGLDSTKNYGRFGVKASADVTEQLNVGATVKSYGDAEEEAMVYGVGATYTENLLQTKFNYDTTTFHATSVKPESAAVVEVQYRGSTDNNEFGKLFGTYQDNVAFAFQGKYTMNTDSPGKPASIIELNATGPVIPGQFWLKGNVTLRQHDTLFITGAETGHPKLPQLSEAEKNAKDVVVQAAKSRTTLSVEGYAPVGKLVFKPKITSDQWTEVIAQHQDKDGNPKAAPVGGNVGKFELRLDVDYKLADNASITAYFGQASYSGTDTFANNVVNWFNGVGVKVSF